MRLGARTFALAALAACAAPSPCSAAAAPLVRVGLETGAAEVRVAATTGGLLLSEGGSAPRAIAGPLRFAVRAGAAPAPVPSRWFVDVREERDAAQARRVAEALRETVGAPLSVEPRGERHVVTAGPFRELTRAAELLDLLSAAGMQGATLRELGGTRSAASRLVRIDESWKVRDVPGEAATLRAEGGRLLLDGKPFRGELRLRLDGRGRLVVVNALPLESYLRGVVPEELGPASFPELEALASQAVAARTWVLTQLGRHEADGYDVCPTAHCQVYGGAGSEQELSDRAVRETEGRVLGWNGEPATTYFSSTCGGRTEAVENVFDHEPVPYLKGVSCYPEKLTFSHLHGRPIQADWSRVDGTPAHDVLLRLWAWGVVDDDQLQRGGFTRRADPEEAQRWLQAAAAVTGATVRKEAPLDTSTALAFLRSLQEAWGWGPRRKLIAPADVAAASRFTELRGLDEAGLVTALLALKAGHLPEGLQPDWGDGRLSRGNVLEVLDRWLASRGAHDVRALRFLAREGSQLLVLDGRERRRVALVPQPALAASRKGLRPVPREELELKISDKIRLLGPAGGPARALLLEEDPDGAAFDRTSVYSWWERRTPFAEVARQARKRAGVEGLKDLSVKRVSPAGRVVAVELVDRRGRKSLLEGFSARGLLGLPDARAQVEVERGADGRPTAVRATGRGWGHGVGLCQFGAYGMALAGEGREAILAHYFPGAELVPLETLRLPARPR